MQTVSPTHATTLSRELFDRASCCIPGGVNSPVRAFGAVGGTPRFIARGEGAHLIDEDGNRYIDYIGSWGPLILGHAHPKVMQAVLETAQKGLSFGAPTRLEVELAEEVKRRIPHIEKIRMVNSGTEATMSAIRLARGVTSRNKIVKFEGCYHGHSDCLLVKAGSGALTFGNPSSPGVPKGATDETLIATFNDLNSVRACFEQHGQDIACIILEPVTGNMNMVLPEPGFLEELRQLCNQYGAILIFDEVMTGFRLGPQGMQSITAVIPDMTTFGKIIGGGMPVGAFGGRAEIMRELSPEGPVYQAGTLSGNPVAMAAGLATLRALDEKSYSVLWQKTKKLVDGILQAAKQVGIPMTANYHCGMFGLFFSNETKISHYHQVMQCNKQHFNQFFHGMLQQGVYLAPSSFEAGFVSLAHSDKLIDQTIEAAKNVLHDMTNMD